jgi:hypothetical protein
LACSSPRNDQLLQRASEPVGHRTAIANIIVEERIE